MIAYAMPSKADEYYQLVREVILFIDRHHTHHPEKIDIAKALNISQSDLQQIFMAWGNMSPEQCLRYISKSYAKALLIKRSSLCSHHKYSFNRSKDLNLLIDFEPITPTEYNTMTEVFNINYGTYMTRFGLCFIANTKRGICHLSFLDEPQTLEQPITLLTQQWPNALLNHNQSDISNLAETIFNIHKTDQARLLVTPIKLLVKGTTFQQKVWKALINVHPGELASYNELAQIIQQPKATRAVASALARNNIAYLIPCHRVIKSNGELNQYHWGRERKAAIIAWEQANILTKHQATSKTFSTIYTDNNKT